MRARDDGLLFISPKLKFTSMEKQDREHKGNL